MSSLRRPYTQQGSLQASQMAIKVEIHVHPRRPLPSLPTAFIARAHRERSGRTTQAKKEEVEEGKKKTESKRGASACCLPKEKQNKEKKLESQQLQLCNIGFACRQSHSLGAHQHKSGESGRLTPSPLSTSSIDIFTSCASFTGQGFGASSSSSWLSKQ